MIKTTIEWSIGGVATSIEDVPGNAHIDDWTIKDLETEKEYSSIAICNSCNKPILTMYDDSDDCEFGVVNSKESHFFNSGKFMHENCSKAWINNLK